jgi:hypothetical protein
MLIGPVTDMVPPETVTPEVLPLFPIRKLDGLPLKLNAAVLNVPVNAEVEDSKTTSPVVFTLIAVAPLITSPVTVTLPLGAVPADVAPRL